MAMAGDFSTNYVAVQGSGSVLADGQGQVKWLGSVLWFTLAETRINREALQALLVESGLGEEFLPREISHRDAFRKATTNAARQRVELTDGNMMNVNVVEIGTHTEADRANKTKNERLVYGIVREIKNAQGERLNYEVVAKAVLDGEAASITAEPGVIMGEVEGGVANGILAQYEDLRTNYTRRNVSEMVDRVLATCSPVNLRPSGGVYFTPREVQRVKRDPATGLAEKDPATGAEVLEKFNVEARVKALQRFVKALAQYKATSTIPTLWTVPVIDGDEHAEMLQASLQEQIKAQALTLVEEMKGATTLAAEGKKKITEAAAIRWIDQTKALSAMVKEYKGLVSGLQIEAEADLDAARMFAMQMLEKVQ